MPCATLLAGAAALLAPAPACQEAEGPARVVLPPGPAAAAWSAVGPDTVPATLDAAPWPPWPDDPAWNGAEPWTRWVDLVLAEARAAKIDPTRRATLAILAAEQGRDGDAWDHFTACGESPGVLTALLPHLLPGAAARPGPLPDGCLLRPALPPIAVDAAAGPARPGEMRIRGLRIGEATLSMRVSLEGDGIEVAFLHEGGGAAHLRLTLPRPRGQEIRALYVDWTPMDDPGAVVELDIRPGDEELAVWGRFLSTGSPWPTALPQSAPAQLVRAGLVVEIDPGDPQERRLAAFAAAIGRLLGVASELRLRGPREAAPGGEMAPLRVHLCADLDPVAREGKLATILSLAERYALRPDR